MRLAHRWTQPTLVGSLKPFRLARAGIWSSFPAVANRRRFWIVLWAAGAAGELAVLWPVFVGDGPMTWAWVFYLATGGSFVAAGLMAWQRRPANHVGVLMVATGSLFVMEQLAGQSGTSLVQTLGLLFSGYWMIPFVILLLVFPEGRWITGRLEQFVVVAVAAPLVMQPFWMVFLEQPGIANDLGLWPNARAADWIDKGQRGILMLAAVSLCLVVGWRWWIASRPLRRVLLPVLAGGATMLSLAAMLALDLINGARSQSLLTVTAGVLATVPIAFLGGLLRSRLARVGLGDLLVGLRDQPSPTELKNALAKSLGDSSLDLLFWLPDFRTYADLDGREAKPPEPHDGRAWTPIDADGVPIAALVHDRALVEEPELLAAVGAAASIALQRARLHAELAARLEEVRGSRARIVEAGQNERRRLERNLHDGAQQRLVALSLQLSLLEGRLAGDPEAQAGVDEARREIAASLAELRDLARGLHPAVVSDHGLDIALEQVLARASVPVTLSIDTGGRLPEGVEVAAFYVVSETLANVGKYARAASASVEVTRRDGRVVIEVTDDGCGGADAERGSGIRGLADRVEALDGRLQIWSPEGGGTRVLAEIPCES
jgi:signal transduction histidine kinase